MIYSALYGTFELDDYVHLESLSTIKTLSSFIDYTFFQFSSSGKRFLSMFTFALQADSWPNPFYFKLINLIIHLCNAIIIYWISFQLFSLNFNKQKSLIAALFVFGLWLFAPIHIFSVFYVIQRMNLLAIFFTLTGCATYIYFRIHSQKNNYSLKQYIYLSFFISLSLGASIASKENGILLCVYLIVLESAFFSHKVTNNYWKIWKVIFLWLPLFLLIIYLLLNNRLSYSAATFYPFSSEERLVNQMVILVEYMVKIILPSYGQYGLIYDDINIYRSWLNNTVILSYLLIIGLLIGSYITKRKQPYLFFGIFWFFGGHLLESTAIRLELYFDHRNYLPSFGLYFIFTYYTLAAWNRIKTPALKLLTATCLLLYVIITINVLYKTSNAFSSAQSLSAYQMKFHPDSKRAILKSINYFFNHHYYDKASSTLSEAIQTDPKNISLLLYQIYASNLRPEFKIPAKSIYLSVLKKGEIDRALDAAVYAIFYCINDNTCKLTSYSDLRQIIDALLSNTKITQSTLTELLTVIKAKTYQHEGNWEAVLKTLQEYESRKKITNIDFYFIILQSQYMAEQYNSAQQTIVTIEELLEDTPLKRVTLREYLGKFKKIFK
ncbi:MAG: hypothetical protein KZQ70_12225 [gamma proteobacterium symbiont of Lucinoma myriamae]|nr:hypothetical protein [gamma proteobacterium symbiont of Lucinoma myriamae]